VWSAEQVSLVSCAEEEDDDEEEEVEEDLWRWNE